MTGKEIAMEVLGRLVYVLLGMVLGYILGGLVCISKFGGFCT